MLYDDRVKQSVQLLIFQDVLPFFVCGVFIYM